jgi:hypothetical protein
MKSTLHTDLTLPVHVSFELLPEMLVDGTLLPTQVDISQVIVEIPDITGKPRRVNLLNALDEGTIMLLEDEVLASL